MIHLKQLIFILTFYTTTVIGQESKIQEILHTDSTWQHEHFDFPLSFAPDIKLIGFEDARFPTEWSNQDSSAFWSYVFAWKIEVEKKLNKKELKKHLTSYFSGLMNDVENTSVQLSEGKSKNMNSYYSGRINTIDAFFTKNLFTLNVTIEQHYCIENTESIIIFRFSPKEFDDEIWIQLSKVKLLEDICIN